MTSFKSIIELKHFLFIPISVKIFLNKDTVQIPQCIKVNYNTYKSKCKIAMGLVGLDRRWVRYGSIDSKNLSVRGKELRNIWVSMFRSD